ncbi:MAG TPA: four helix bundle protein [Candidatus Acidoferrales bacterium]
MTSRPEELRERTKQFALRVLRMTRVLPRTEEAFVIRRQILRSAFSVAANYGAVCRARSPADFAAKMALVLEEADESNFWLEMLVAAGIVKNERLRPLSCEAEELVRIFSSSLQTARRNHRKK